MLENILNMADIHTNGTLDNELEATTAVASSNYSDIEENKNTCQLCGLGGPVIQKCSFIFCPNILINRYTPKTDIPRVSNDLETFLTLLPLAENLILAHFCHFKGFWGPY